MVHWCRVHCTKFMSPFFMGKTSYSCINRTPFIQLQSRFFSKYLSKSATKRLPLTTKRAGKGYYKGNGCRSEGRHTSKGGYVMDKSKMLELVVPDLTGFKVSLS